MFYFFNLPITDPAWAGAALLLSAALVMMAWASGGLRVLAAPQRQGAALASAFLLILLWMLRASVQGTLAVTFSGASLAVILFGLRAALLMLALADLGFVAVDALSAAWSHYSAPRASPGIDALMRTHWQNLGLQFLLGAALPACITRGLIALIRARLPRHLFVFIFGHGFFSPALATVVTLVAGALAIHALQVPGSDAIFREVLPTSLLLAWGEAFMTGALGVIFIMFRPQWVASFRDEDYLKKPAEPGGDHDRHPDHREP